MADKLSVYFPNLNGLRFFAALLVIIHHVEQFKFIFGLDSAWESSSLLREIGHLGVLLFFTLSGFLITYLLLAEEKQFGRINIREFYIRRILRIWPLYFLIFLLAILVWNRLDFFMFPGFSPDQYDLLTVCLFFLFFLSNVFLAFYGALPYAAQTWSVSVEEQFYVFWPLVVKFTQNRVRSILIIIGLIVGIRILLIFGDNQHWTYFSGLRVFWKLFNIDCMGIGGLAGILLFSGSRFLKLLFSNMVFFGSLLLLFLIVGFQIRVPVLSAYFETDIYAVLFALLILNLAANKRFSRILEIRPLNYLGKISYGLYMYHGIAIVISIRLLAPYAGYQQVGIYMSAFLITIIFSALSYHFFEMPFLRLKHKFSKITTLVN